MIEIKLTLDDPRMAARQLRHAANHWNDGAPKPNPVGDLLRTMADSIEEQVKPKVEEPELFGSIVRAWHPSENSDEVAADEWQQSPMRGKHYWENCNGVIEVWSDLVRPEVLRVGIGEPSETDRDAFDAGFSACRSVIYNRLHKMLKSANNAWYPSHAIEQMLAAVEELAP